MVVESRPQQTNRTAHPPNTKKRHTKTYSDTQSAGISDTYQEDMGEENPFPNGIPLIIIADSEKDGRNKSKMLQGMKGIHLPSRRKGHKDEDELGPGGLSSNGRSGILPSNSVEVKCPSSQENDFQPVMLLLSSMERAHMGPIWVLKFSPDGKYLATGGEDGNILIWEIGSGAQGSGSAPKESAKGEEKAPSRRRSTTGGNNSKGGTSRTSSYVTVEQGMSQLGFTDNLTQGSGPPLGLEVQLVSSEPVQRFTGHTGDVIDVSWSPSNFLLSASIDKTARLWHVSRDECLQTFEHSDFVTSVDFHPRDDQYFLSGGFDRKLRLWSVAKKKVKAWAQAPEAITAARFTPSGHMVVAGLIKGEVHFYSTKGMQFYTQISCKNRSGPQSDGRKVTGLSFRRIVERGPPGASRRGSKITDEGSESKRSIADSSHGPASESGKNGRIIREQLLVTTNDSRLRVVSMDDYTVLHKYKGTTNSTMQIKASYSETGNRIIAGSEGGNVHVWDSSHDAQLASGPTPDASKVDRSSTCASFEACKLEQPIVTSAVFAPSRSVKAGLLGCGLFPTLPTLDHIRKVDFSSAMVVTSDYEGTLRVFMKKTVIDTVFYEAGPEGSIHNMRQEG